MGELSSTAAAGRRVTPLEDGSWRPSAMVRSWASWRSAVYLAAALPLGLAWFIFLVVGLAVSGALTIIWIGIPMLVAMMIGWRLAAVIERALARFVFGAELPSPYRPLPEGRNPLTKLKSMALDPATWKDLLYLGLRLPLGIAQFTVMVAVWTGAGTFLALPFLAMQEGGVEVHLGFVSFWAGNPFAALPGTAVGLLLTLLALYATRTLALGHLFTVRFLLGPNGAQRENLELRRRTEHLRASRARGVDAAEFERRRIERDLHDGAQQRLLAVAMDIGRARAKLDDDPEGARALIEQAHAGTREAITELRDLARGIYPAILTDRGLDPALSGLAGRAPVPVEVEVDLPERPPAAVESIAYFIVAEALANIAKYARATRASVRVAREDAWVVVEVIDNGVGGATARPGGGLSGLADRAATIDGMLIVDSPPGGPTIVRADLPCTW
ncbi:sensor histidine kinase [Actinomadura viridis]|uniref:histidine kinase n=1 Tax=Actinomadura viridis TaxID=58110 RepID=A0A931D9H0_9ACTN|nr:sensor histidine kinase [Actinomadura viridis]MBG6086924.1 signal transduction histidine kinase [Actinomadura viridis]